MGAQPGPAMFVYNLFASGSFQLAFAKLVMLVPGAILVVGVVCESRFVPLHDARRRLLLFSAPFLALGTTTLIFMATTPRRTQVEWWATGPTQLFMAIIAVVVAVLVFMKGGRTRGPLRSYMWSAVAVTHYLVTVPIYLYLTLSAGSVVVVDMLQAGLDGTRGRALACAGISYGMWLVCMVLTPLLKPQSVEDRIRYLYRNRSHSIVTLLRDGR